MKHLICQPQSQPAPSPDYASDLAPALPEPCGCEESDSLRERITELETEIELRRAEHEAANAELRRRIVNQAKALACPRIEDVVEIQTLKARTQMVELANAELGVDLATARNDLAEMTGMLAGKVEERDAVLAQVRAAFAARGKCSGDDCDGAVERELEAALVTAPAAAHLARRAEVTGG